MAEDSTLLSFKDSMTVMAGLALIFGLPCFFIWSLTPDSIKYPRLYQFEYNVRTDHVYLQKEPTDCDWGHAPIGNKDCHYDRVVSFVKGATRQENEVVVSWNKITE